MKLIIIIFRYKNASFPSDQFLIFLPRRNMVSLPSLTLKVNINFNLFLRVKMSRPRICFCLPFRLSGNKTNFNSVYWLTLWFSFLCLFALSPQMTRIMKGNLSNFDNFWRHKSYLPLLIIPYFNLLLILKSWPNFSKSVSVDWTKPKAGIYI